MENLKDDFKGIKYFDSLVTGLNNQDLNDSNYLESLMWSSYFAYVLSNKALAKKVLNTINQCNFDGNYDKWSWVEGGLSLLSRIYKEENDLESSKLIVVKMFETLDYGDDEFKNKLKRKTFQRRANGQLLSKEKIENAKLSKNIELELLNSLVYLKELVFIKEIEESEKFSIEELETLIVETIKRIKELLNL
jgi:hypothetical protein